jgi:hypothetical protein
MVTLKRRKVRWKRRERRVRRWREAEKGGAPPGEAVANYTMPNT